MRRYRVKWAGLVLAAVALVVAGVLGYWYATRPAPTTMEWRAHSRSIADHSGWDDPFGIAIDTRGNLYISDGGERNRIQKIAPDGSVTLVAGSLEGFVDGVAEKAAFHTPSALAIDAQGNLFVADTGNHAIRKIAPDGTVTTLAGTGKPGFRDGPAKQAQFNGPIGIAVDAQGKLWVADTYNDRIRVITTDGQVRTVAGGGEPGFADGPGLTARLDTPCSLVLDALGNVFIADTRNDAVRKLSPAGEVSTLVRGDPLDPHSGLKKPVGLARTHDGFLYASEGSRGRIVQIALDGALRALPAASSSPSDPLAFFRPAGIALGKDGAVYVTDQAHHTVHQLTATAAVSVQTPATNQVASVKPINVLWPVAPQKEWHEVVGTMGEVRGNFEGESRHHFHAGLDVQAGVGDTVLAIANGKVSQPVANWGFGKLSEGINIGPISYIHMRVGRSPRDISLDASRFAQVQDGTGKLARVRVQRGTRFAAGDALGSVNRMAHVHLEYSPSGPQDNPLALPFPEHVDRIAPQITGVRLYDANGQVLSPQRGRVHVSRKAGDLGIVVDAFDQMDGNQARRRLGLYTLGYQILKADGTPAPGFEQPVMNIVFDRLPDDSGAVKLAYWPDSGITVHGSASTRFLYVVTNRVRDGIAENGSWNPGTLASGDYVLRVIAADFAGNKATRTLALTAE
ncbi:MAG: gluconolaconase [Rhodoferax sp.]|nr:gluconolaconase [Rhodoferax sp.]